jgi:glycosyltransferase involved in cell wall biosynthesis
LSPRKGFLFLVEALGRIPLRERPPLRLASNAVDPQERLRVERLAADRGVELQVLVGLDREALAREYNLAALCVYAPHDEPFGLVPLEAMACGTAVVGIKEGGVLESVLDGQTGALAPREPEAFAAAVRDLLARPSLAAEYGRRGREHVLAHWTWEQSVTLLERCLLEAA